MANTTDKEREELISELRFWCHECKRELGYRKVQLPELDSLLEVVEGLDGSERPRVAVAGRFSAGKTAFVNRLLGEKVLPEGLSETTAIPTRVRYGQTFRLLLRRPNGTWVQASEEEQRRFLELRPDDIRKDPLLRRYVEDQQEVVVEHPSMGLDVEVVDLPGVSSSHSKVEQRALRSLGLANGVIWVVNGKDGCLSNSDIRYIGENVPEGTPILFIVTHLDLLPPSNRKAVMAKIEEQAKGVRGSVGVATSSRGEPLDNAFSWQLYRLREAALGNRRVEALMGKVLTGLEGMQERIKEDFSRKVDEMMEAAGLTKESFGKMVETTMNLVTDDDTIMKTLEPMKDWVRKIDNAVSQSVASTHRYIGPEAMALRSLAIAAKYFVFMTAIARGLLERRTGLIYSVFWKGGDVRMLNDIGREGFEEMSQAVKDAAWLCSPALNLLARGKVLKEKSGHVGII